MVWISEPGFVILEPHTRTMSGIKLANTRVSRRHNDNKLVAWIGEILIELEGGQFVVAEEQIVAVYFNDKS